MKKSKSRSQASLAVSKSNIQVPEEIYVPPLDVINVKVLNLQVTDETPKFYSIKVIFFDQILLTEIIKSVGTREHVKEKTLVQGSMNYDPSDYEKMSLMADCPLVVNIQPLYSVPSMINSETTTPCESYKSSSSTTLIPEISCCNVDILQLFIDEEKLLVKKRMEPMIEPPLLQRQSWDNLPLITMELSVIRNQLNSLHHMFLKQANYISFTLVGAYNVPISTIDDEHIITAATKTVLHNDTNTDLITFSNGRRKSEKFQALNFYRQWEYLKLGDNLFTKGDEKFACELEQIQNEDNIDIAYYISKSSSAIVWGSFHRTLLLPRGERWLTEHLRRYCWPFEVHLYGEQGGISFMAFLQLFRLLYPGEHIARMAVPLQWMNTESMKEKCNCELPLTPHIPQIPTSSALTSSSELSGVMRSTGNDDNSSFIIVEVKLTRPLKEAVVPPIIPTSEIYDMLKRAEEERTKRESSGRGQLDREWQKTVKSAETSLRKVPHYGMTEFCAFNRQLSETRTRVELMTSCWLSAAVYINNNFVVQNFLRSEDTYEEMLMVSHACLTRIACNTLLGSNNQPDIDPTLRAARHARQIKDISHATALYLQHVVNRPREANGWRELSTCLMDVDIQWANVCINKSLVVDPRHRLSLLSKASKLYDEDPEAAEIFFQAILTLFPFWSTGWVVANAYYLKQKLFHMADQVMKYMKKTMEEGLTEHLEHVGWGQELGDWWDATPLLPGMNQFYIAADMLLRLRSFTLAEVCLSRGVLETGETAVFYHLLALCCRLRGDVDEALCHLQQAIDKFGDIIYLRALQAECYHEKKNFTVAMKCFEKSGSSLNPHSVLLSLSCWEKHRARSLILDLIRRQPSAYAWVALAEDWLQQTTAVEDDEGDVIEDQVGIRTCAVACAVQALKWDRQAGRAWALLSRLVAPSARRELYIKIAQSCDYEFTEKRTESSSESKQSLCYRLGKVLWECPRCFMCKHLKI